MSRQPRCLFPGHCGSVKQDNKRYFILYLKLASCEGRPAGRNEVERIKLNFGVGEMKNGRAAVHLRQAFVFQLLVFSFESITKCVFALQWYARHPVDESRSSQADGGAESVHVAGGI